MIRLFAVSCARACEHARGRSTGLWADCTVKRGGDGGSNVVRSTLGAVTLATVEVVSALVGPHTTVDRAGDANCHTDDGANHNKRDENADGPSLVLAVASPVVLDCSASAGTGSATLLLVFQTSLPQGLVCGPHCAFLVAAADLELLAEGVLVVSHGVRGSVAAFKVLLRGCEGRLDRGWCNALVGGWWVGVEGRVWRQRGVVGEGGIVVGGGVPGDGGSESW